MIINAYNNNSNNNNSSNYNYDHNGDTIVDTTIALFNTQQQRRRQW